MSSTERSIPPGRGRIAAAARAGLFATSGRLAAGLVLLAAAGVLLVNGGVAADSLTGLVSAGLDAAVVHRGSPAETLLAVAGEGLVTLVPLAATVFAVALAAVLVPAIIARRGAGRSAVPLPDHRGERGITLAVRLAGGVLFVLLAAFVWRSHVGALVLLAGGDTSAARGLGAGLVHLLAAGGASLVLVGLAETAIERHGIWKALHLDTAEARREARAAGGDRALKAETRRRALRAGR